ncbi:MAG TPA: T9SS type A sorting domain-containing protein, partial [Segetibacter sp.]
EPVLDSNVLGPDNKLTKPRVFPNPSPKRFKIEFPAEASGYSTIQLADASGRLYEIGRIKLQRGRTNNMEVDISRWSLKPGFYYLKILYETRANDVIKLIVK